MKLENAKSLVREALGMDGSKPIGIEPVSGPNRNTVFKVFGSRACYLKVYRKDSSPDVSAREAMAAQALSGVIPVPGILAHGVACGFATTYLISEAKAGRSLDQLLSGLDKIKRTALLNELHTELRRVADDPIVHQRFSNLPGQSEGVHAADFSPIEWIDANDQMMRDVVTGLAYSGSAPLMGSMSGNNLIVASEGKSLKVSAFIDFEGARIGPKGFDQAMFWYDLLLNKHVATAESWLQIVLDHSDSQTMAGVLANAAWLSAFRSHHYHVEQRRDRKLRRFVKDRLLKLRTEKVFS